MWQVIYKNFEGEVSTEEETTNGKKGEKGGEDLGLLLHSVLAN